jgi:hypothetical protein
VVEVRRPPTIATSVILEVYSHVIAGLGEAAAQAMRDALGGDPGVGGVGDDDA